jgi:hypothetical protein
MRIYKYELEITDTQTIMMPSRAKLLSVQPSDPNRQENRLWVWALVDEKVPSASREFLIVGTGNPCNINFYAYLGTCMMPNGLVWHVFHRPL